MEVPTDTLDSLVFQFALGPLGDLVGASFECSLRLPSIMLGLNVGIKRRVREIPFPTSTLKISPLLIFSGSAGSCLFQLIVGCFILHDLYFYTVKIVSQNKASKCGRILQKDPQIL